MRGGLTLAGAERREVVAAVLIRGRRVLLCRRPLSKRHGGLWEFPGGKVHEGESASQALARELAEELGLALVSAGGQLAAFDDPGSAFTVCFHPVDATGEPRAHEHEAIAWVPIAEVAGFPLAPSDRRFVEHGGLERLAGASRRACPPAAPPAGLLPPRRGPSEPGD